MLGGRTPTQRAVRPLRVVAFPPLLDEFAGVCQAAKPADSEALVAKVAVEALQMAVLHGLARIDEIQFDVVLVRPGIERLPGKLGAVIQCDPLGWPMPVDQVLQEADDSSAWQRR